MPLQATRKQNATLPSARRTSQGKGMDPDITSQTIASDLAAFRRQGGRIEVLGNTPLRPSVTAFTSKGDTRRKTSPVPVAKSTGRG